MILSLKIFLASFRYNNKTTMASLKTAMDQVNEQTCNKDTKTKGDLIGFTQKPAFVERWILSHNKRAEI